MIASISSVDEYLATGCGRCPLWNSPACKVHAWQEELTRLRAIILSCGLTEELKWKVPCYTSEKRNVVLIGAFKEYCALSFFKGALLKDPKGILSLPGENSQAGRLIRFTSIREVTTLESTLKDYIREAVAIEKAGLKVSLKNIGEREIPEELQHRFEELPALKAAFNALTPGRQRGYLLHFAAPKQSKTREARVEKCIPRILEGKGMQDT